MPEIMGRVLLVFAVGCSGDPDVEPDDTTPEDTSPADTTPESPVESCDPILQTGCDTGEKCGELRWPDGRLTLGCVPDGSVDLDGACAFGPSGPADGEPSDCRAGLECRGGTCEQICAQDAETSSCPAYHACVPAHGHFEGSTYGFCSTRCPILPGDVGQDCVQGDACYLITGTTTCGTPYCETDPCTGIEYECGHGDRCDDGGDSHFLNVCNPGRSCIPWNSPIGPSCTKLCRVSQDVLSATDDDFPAVKHRGGEPGFDCARDDDGPQGTLDAPLPAADCVALAHATSKRYALYGGEGIISEGYLLPPDLGVCLDHATFGEYYTADE